MVKFCPHKREKPTSNITFWVKKSPQSTVADNRQISAFLNCHTAERITGCIDTSTAMAVTVNLLTRADDWVDHFIFTCNVCNSVPLVFNVKPC